MRFKKRVVLELAVIKLCKPEMETDYSALLDRVRVLEQKLEQGTGAAAIENRNDEANTPHAGSSGEISQELVEQICARLQEEGIQTAVQAVPGDAEKTTQGLSEQLKKELPEANYNELKEFIEQWDVILDGYQHITKKVFWKKPELI